MNSGRSHDEVTLYNTLFEVADADRALEACGRSASIEAVLAPIREHGLERAVCLRLLHKHNDIQFDERMIETSIKDQEGFALVTRPVKHRSLGDNVPNSWKLVDGEFFAIEYSESSLLALPMTDPKRQKDAFASIADALSKNGLAHILGPSLMYSGLVASYRPVPDMILLERTDAAARANVMRYARPDHQSRNIETKWFARAAVSDEGEVVWSAAIECACSVFPGGGHTGTHVYIPPPPPPPTPP